MSAYLLTSCTPGREMSARKGSTMLAKGGMLRFMYFVLLCQLSPREEDLATAPKEEFSSEPLGSFLFELIMPLIEALLMRGALPAAEGTDPALASDAESEAVDVDDVDDIDKFEGDGVGGAGVLDSGTSFLSTASMQTVKV